MHQGEGPLLDFTLTDLLKLFCFLPILERIINEQNLQRIWEFLYEQRPETMGLVESAVNFLAALTPLPQSTYQLLSQTAVLAVNSKGKELASPYTRLIRLFKDKNTKTQCGAFRLAGNLIVKAVYSNEKEKEECLKQFKLAEIEKTIQEVLLGSLSTPVRNGILSLRKTFGIYESSFSTKTEDIEIGKFKEYLEIDQAFVVEGSEDLMMKSNQIGKLGLAERAQTLSDINLIIEKSTNTPEKFEARVFHALYIHTLKTENEEKENEKKRKRDKKTFRKRSSIGSYLSTAASI